MANTSAGVDPAGRAQPPDRVLRQAPQRQPADPARGRRLPEQLLQGMLAGQLVVAVGQHQHSRQLGDPAGQVPQHVQGGLVGPVHVLHHQDGRVPGPVQLGPQRGQHRVPLAALAPAPGSARRRPGRPGPGTAPGSAGCPGRRSGRPAGAPSAGSSPRSARTRLDLPMPASPKMSTSPPSPAAASRAAWASSASSRSRSRSTGPATSRVCMLPLPATRRAPERTRRDDRSATTCRGRPASVAWVNAYDRVAEERPGRSRHPAAGPDPLRHAARMRCTSAASSCAAFRHPHGPRRSNGPAG